MMRFLSALFGRKERILVTSSDSNGYATAEAEEFAVAKEASQRARARAHEVVKRRMAERHWLEEALTYQKENPPAPKSSEGEIP